MALISAERIKESTTIEGTSDIVLEGAYTGYRAFSSVMASSGDICYYCIDDGIGGWEVGIGAYTLSTLTLTRNTVLASSNSGSKTVFGAGTKSVFMTVPATGFAYPDSTNGKAYRIGFTNGAIEAIEVATS